MDASQNAKKLAGERAVHFIEDGMNVGLGTGSTVYWSIHRLAKRVAEGLHVRCIPTSEQTRALATKLGIPLTSFAQVSELDVAIDGADEVDPEYNLIKGGGGALLREKLIALSAKQMIVVVDETKRVPTLGQFPLPVEIVPFAHETTLLRLRAAGCNPILRTAAGNSLFVTDNGNYIADCSMGAITDPQALQTSLKQLTGVIETGLFTGICSHLVISDGQKVEVIEKVASSLEP